MTNKHFSPRNIFHLAAALTILIVTFACGGTAATPSSSSTEQPAAAVEPTFVPVPTSTAPEEETPGETAPSPAIPEMRRLTLEYPPKMKAGVESDVIRLTLEVDEQGNITPTAQVEGNVITGETIQIPNLYETHMVTAEARIDMAGMDVQPAGAIYEPMTPGQSVKFFWSIRPQDTGLYRGTVWLHLVFVDRISGEESRMAVSAQIVEIEAVDFFGFSVNVARTSGVVGSIVGGIVGFPFLEDIIKFLFKRRKKK
ncbi:MAG: hypothetical protein IPO22_01885 [Anaerolineales bacterium]|nr:hypothetical protein [Anaerolineales bacterium]